MISATTATQSFDPAAGLGSSDSLSDYANASVSWLQGQNQQASNQLDYQNSLVTQATAALSNATGVNLDTEMTNMLNIENSYTTTAKLLTTVNDMFTAADQRGVTPMTTAIRLHDLSRRPRCSPAITQAQIDAHAARSRAVDRPIRRPRPAARRPVRLRTVAAQPERSAADADQPPTASSTTNLTTAQAALNSIRTDAQSAVVELDVAGPPGRNQLDSTSADARRQRAAVADRHDQHDVQRPVCVRRRSIPASRRWPTISRRRLRRPRARSTRRSRATFGFAPTDRGGLDDLRLGRCRVSSAARSPRMFSGAELDDQLVVGLEHQHDGQIAPGETIDDLDQRQPARVPATRARATRCSPNSAARR